MENMFNGLTEKEMEMAKAYMEMAEINLENASESHYAELDVYNTIEKLNGEL